MDRLVQRQDVFVGMKTGEAGHGMDGYRIIHARSALPVCTRALHLAETTKVRARRCR
jgi:hypothetical protein